MRRLGAAVLILLCSLHAPQVLAEPEPAPELLDEERPEEQPEAAADEARDEEQPHPCASPLDPEMAASTTTLRVDSPTVTLTLPLDVPVDDTDERACVWTGDPANPFYAASTRPCAEDFPECRTVTLRPLTTGQHTLVVRVGEASPLRFEVEQLAADCSLRPVPVLDPGKGHGYDDDDDDDAPTVGRLFQAGSGPFKLTLPEPVVVDEDTSACWWFVPPGLDEQIAHQWSVQPCEGQDPTASTCVQVTAPAWIAPGRYVGAVAVGTGETQDATLWVPPRLWLLWLLTLAGFVVWVVVTIFLKGVVVLSRLERWQDELQRRLEGSRDDHKLLLARVWSALDFAGVGLRRNKLLLAFNDLAPLEQHLREAEQLLTLSERKMEIWDRADAQLYPPTLVAQIVTELKLFDEVVLQHNFPLSEEEGSLEGEFPPLRRAANLLDAAEFDLDKNLHAAMGLALGLTGSGDYGYEQDEEEQGEDEEGSEDGGEGEDEATREDEADEDPEAVSALELVRRARERERERLRTLAPRLTDAYDFAPTLRLEADLRLDVLHKLERLLASPELHEHLETSRLREALGAWGRADLQDSFSHQDHRRLHRDVIRWSIWRPENRRFAGRLDELRRAQKAILDETQSDPAARARAIAEGRVPLTVRCPTAEPWRTFSPRTLRVTLNREFRDLGESFVWRRLIRVDWYEQGDHLGKDLCVISTDADGGCIDAHVVQSGPDTVSFARKEGSFVIAPTVVLPVGSDSGTGGTEGLRIPVAPVAIEVSEGTREIQNKRIQVYNGARTAISLVGSITAAVMLFEGWRADPPLYVYWRALLVPIGVDLSTIALPAAMRGLRRVLERRSSAPGRLLRDDEDFEVM